MAPQVETEEGVEEKEAEVKKPKAKKAKAQEKKAPAKKPPAKKAAEKGGEKKVGGRKKEGLRSPQLRILQALAKAKGSLTREEISEKAPCDRAWLNEWLGSHDEEIRAKNDEEKFMSLLSLKLIRYAEKKESATGRQSYAYEITAAGKQAVEKSAKAAKE